MLELLLLSALEVHNFSADACVTVLKTPTPFTKHGLKCGGMGTKQTQDNDKSHSKMRRWSFSIKLKRSFEKSLMV